MCFLLYQNNKVLPEQITEGRQENEVGVCACVCVLGLLKLLNITSADTT